MRAGECVDFACGKAEEVGGYLAIPCCDNDIKMGIELAKEVRCSDGFVKSTDWKACEGGELAPVGGDPGDQRQERVEALETF